jgi:hypothetical protein
MRHIRSLEQNARKLSSQRTLSTIHEAAEKISLSSSQNFKSGTLSTSAKIGSANDTEDLIRHIILHTRSDPELFWALTVEQLVAQRNQNCSKGTIRELFDEDIGEESKTDAFTKLRILNQQVKEGTTLSMNTRFVLRSRESQLRRKIYKLQGE